MKTIHLFVYITLAFFYVLVGCEANLTEEWQEEYAESCDEELLKDLQDIPRLHLDHPLDNPQPWETDAAVLRDSVAAHDGQAIIGLKAPESKRFRENHGFREAISAEQVEAAMHMLCSRGIEITDVYNIFGGVAVIMDPDEVFYLFDHPMVDYIDFPMEYRLGWEPSKEWRH